MHARTASLTLAAMVAFAANSLLCRAALGGGLADAASFTSMRLVGGALVLVPLTRLRGGSEVGGGSWTSAAALFAYALGFSLAYLSIPAGTGALLLFGAVQLTMLASALVAGERPAAREWLGLVLSLVGLVALTRPGLAQPNPVGAGLMLVAGMAWGVYSLRGRSAADPTAATAGNFARAVPLALLPAAVALALGEVSLSRVGLLWAVLSGAVTSGLGYVMWYAVVRELTATRAAIVQLAVPVLAAGGGVALLDEPVTPRLVVASAAILGGVALATLSRERQPAA